MIVELFFERNENAIAEAASKYGSKLKSIATNITQNINDAEECVNDTYLHAWNSIPPNNPSSLFAYLAKIVRNSSLNILKKRQADKRCGITVELSNELEECLPSQTDVWNEFNAHEIQNIINKFVRELDDDTQYIFVRRYFYMDTLNEIAKATGKSISSVNRALQITRNSLKKLLSEEKEGDIIL